MRQYILLAALLLWNKEIVNSIRLVELRVPGHAATDGEALLGCHFDLEEDLLYSVSWYKDNKMFYRYTPGNDIKAAAFPTKGVTVDLSRSSSDVVTLVNLTTDSAGLYRCEVAGEKPRFDTAAAEKYINIHILPKLGPQLSGIQYQYNVGDLVKVNCTSMASRPEAKLNWFINKKLATKRQLLGPWKRVVDDPPDTTESTLGLRFRVTAKHFVGDVMELKCQSTIAPLYQQEKVHRVSIASSLPIIPDPIFPTENFEEAVSKETEHENSQNFLWFIPQTSTESSPSKGNSIWRCKLNTMHLMLITVVIISYFI